MVEKLVDEPIYGFDTEFHRERTYWPRLALLQVAWEGGIVLVDPLALDISPFRQVLEGPGLAVGHAVDQDLEVLERATGAVPKRLFDTQVAAGFLGLTSPSLATLVERFLGRRLTKGDRLTDWTARPLNSSQRAYAAADVEHLLALYDEIGSRLRSAGRLDWAETEFELLLSRDRGGPVPEQAWWRIKDARSLRGRSKGVAQAVAAWRETKAAQRDVPPRFVLSDLALSSIAHRPPDKEEELTKVRGIQGRLSPRDATDLIGAVRRGLSLEEDDVCTPPTETIDRKLRPAATLVGAWIAQRAAELSIDPAILATKADLYALLGQKGESRLSAGWRKEVTGLVISDVAAGRVALALDGRRGLVLEERSHRPVDLPPAGTVDLDGPR